MTNKFIPNFNETSSYALGLLWADGWMSYNKKGFNGKHLRIEVVSQDFEDFKDSLNTLGKLTSSERQRNGRQKQTIALITNSGFCEWLYEKGFMDKSRISPCEVLKSIPSQYHRDFMRGWIDGDGCFYIHEKNRTYQFVLAGTYSQDWTAFTGFLNTLKVKFSYRQKTQTQNGRENKCSIIRVTGIENLNRLVNAVYHSEASNFLKRKKEKAKSIPDNLVYARKSH